MMYIGYDIIQELDMYITIKWWLHFSIQKLEEILNKLANRECSMYDMV